jgi:hypothetical protein
LIVEFSEKETNKCEIDYRYKSLKIILCLKICFEMAVDFCFRLLN